MWRFMRINRVLELIFPVLGAPTHGPSFYGHGFIGYPKGRNVERALGPSCPYVLCISYSLGLYLLHQI